VIAEAFLDAQQLVVLGDAIGSVVEPVLIWPALVATAMSGDRCLLRLAGPVADDRAEAVAPA